MTANRVTLRTVIASNRNRNSKLKTSKAPLKSEAQGTSLFTSAASNQRGFPKNSPWEARVCFPEGESCVKSEGFSKEYIARGKLRSGCQKVRGGRATRVYIVTPEQHGIRPVINTSHDDAHSDVSTTDEVPTLYEG